MRHWLFPAFFTVCVLGCGGSRTETKDPQNPGAAKRKEAERVNALQIIGQTTEAAQFRDALQMLTNSCMSEPEAVKDMEQTASAQRDFLRQQMFLANEEMSEVEAGSFQPMDAHYLEACTLLRDAARSLEKANLPPLDLARLVQGWVCRQVLAGAPRAHSWIPSHLVLRNGFGSPSDRSLLFLAMLRQCQLSDSERTHGLGRIEGCVLGSPHPLVGVLLPADPDNLYLFDMNLGTPVPGPDGKGVATLAQVRKDPGLLKAAGVPEKDFADSEYYLNCPLSALSPRMRVLEDLLREQESPALFMDAPAIHKAVAHAAQTAVRPGNPIPSPGSQLRNSPTRSLRWFLPPDEGGRQLSPRDPDLRDVLFRSAQLQQALRQRSKITLNFYALKLMDTKSSFIPKEVGDALLNEASEFMYLYAVQPRDLLLRGQSAALLKRLNRLARPLEEMDSADPNEIQNEATTWRQLAHKSVVLQTRKDPQGIMLMNSLWQDPYYDALKNLNTDFDPRKLDQPDPLAGKDDGKKKPRRVVTHLILAGCKDVLDLSVAYQLAVSAHEPSEAYLAVAESLLRRGKDAEAGFARQKAKNSWQSTYSHWNKFTDRYTMGAPAVRERLNYILRTIQQTGDFETGYLPSVLRDWTTSCNARLNLATAQLGKGDAARARATLDNLAQDLKLLAGDAGLQTVLDSYLKLAGDIRLLPSLLEQQRLIAAEFRGGTLTNLQQIVDMRRKALPPEK